MDPLHLVAARLRSQAAPAEDDEDWDAVIARAKMQAAAPPASRPPPPPSPRNEWAEMAPTPPPSPAQRAGVTEATQATLDALLSGGTKKPAAGLPAFTSRRRAPTNLATPLPVGPISSGNVDSQSRRQREPDRRHR